ncbi:hypothetical protein COS61_01885 [Candidatus Wolfebacteria bacterium CG03_land_8_20_14_0_80_40_12]|uniref:Uncharacterized protein n=1 Tax=Candidatus Wolfebacteria bacterium CG03_land_8_20_14_0_80_40_12 TaxID=1975069 RepID=A0A2M7B5I8_9BACT|nr:MAG: hypothetical protein COS61_01885 [Candidatus Wolfebacteria bacterium CG03_land_8_20_14_0_80_40_12]
MNNKQKILLIGVGIIVIVGILFLILKTNILRPSPSPANVPAMNNESKIYTVKEAVDLLKTNPTSLKDNPIQLEAFVVDGVMGLGCKDYQIITDKEYVEAFNNRYNNKLSQEERNKAIEESKQAPVLLTGQTLAMPEGFFPTYHAIYQGHFYDKWATKTCGADGYKRFVIDGKVREIVSAKQSAYRTKIISAGLVIANGKYIQKPYEVTLKDYKVTINGILYEPPIEEQVNRITEFTDDQRLKQWESLISVLERNGLIIYGGNKYESTKWNYLPTLVSDIDTLMKSNKSAQQKREDLAKLLDTFPEDTMMNDILRNWK